MMAILRRSVRSTNIHSPYFKCRCEEGVLPDEAISQSLEIATPFGLAMTGSLHTKTPDGEGRGFYLNKIKRSACKHYFTTRKGPCGGKFCSQPAGLFYICPAEYLGSARSTVRHLSCVPRLRIRGRAEFPAGGVWCRQRKT